MNYSLCELFSLLDASDAENFSVCSAPGELFFAGTGRQSNGEYSFADDAALISALHSPQSIDFSALPNSAYRLYELSINAFDAFVHTWMSELPLEAELLYFGGTVIAASDRSAAERIAGNRSDADVQAVLDTAYKVWHEINRMQGLLRFSPDSCGRYIAHCEPEYCILPALGGHFSLRFGSTPWAIVDDRRGLCLCCFSSEPPQLYALPAHPDRERVMPQTGGRWENLWLQYHKVINNESRKNPGLQRQFMPARYWKNLPEMNQGSLL